MTARTATESCASKLPFIKPFTNASSTAAAKHFSKHTPQNIQVASMMLALPLSERGARWPAGGTNTCHSPSHGPGVVRCATPHLSHTALVIVQRRLRQGNGWLNLLPSVLTPSAHRLVSTSSECEDIQSRAVAAMVFGRLCTVHTYEPWDAALPRFKPAFYARRTFYMVPSCCVRHIPNAVTPSGPVREPPPGKHQRFTD